MVGSHREDPMKVFASPLDDAVVAVNRESQILQWVGCAWRHGKARLDHFPGFDGAIALASGLDHFPGFDGAIALASGLDRAI